MAFGRPLLESLLRGERRKEWTFLVNMFSMGVVGMR
jgi:hypothetical protein